MASSSSRMPATAIRTTLTTKSLPSVPPSTATYDPIVKAVLRHRLASNIFLLSALYSWILASGWAIWSLGGVLSLSLPDALLTPLKPSTFFGAFALWLIGAVPIVVLRKVFITANRTPASSVEKMVEIALSRPQTLRTAFIYLLSASATLALHVIAAYISEYSVRGDPKLKPFVKSKKHPYYLNGRLIFLLLSQTITAMVFVLRIITLDRFVFPWSLVGSVGKDKTAARLGPSDLFKVCVIATMLATVVVPTAFVMFISGLLALPIIYRLPLLPIILRPFTAHFLRGFSFLGVRGASVPLLCRAWWLGCTTIFTWELSNALFEIYMPQPIVVARCTSEPHVALVSGTSSSHPVFRYFAYHELQIIASEHSQSSLNLRSNLFNDQKYNPSLWSHLARESLLLLGRDYQLLLQRGKLMTPPPPSTPQPAPPPIEIKATPVPLIRKQVFQSGKQPSSPMKAVIDGLSSDGPLAQALQVEAAHIPELFKSVEAVLPKPFIAKEEKVAAVIAQTPRLSNLFAKLSTYVKPTVQRLVPERLSRHLNELHVWWSRERVFKLAQTCCLPNSEIDLIIVDVLSHFVCASLSEDRYGVVQRDIPKILEALLSFLSAVEDFQAEVTARYVPPSPEDDISAEELQKAEAIRMDVAQANEVIVALQDGLREGVARITRTFGDKLLAFKFPPRVAQKLQPFLEYC